MINLDSRHRGFDTVQQQKGRSPVAGCTNTHLRPTVLVGRSNSYLVPPTFGVDKHKQRLHELRGKRLHQEGLPAAILKL